MAVLNYTTKVSTGKTVGEVQQVLAKAGASAVSVRYADGIPCGLEFELRTPHGPRRFVLPVDVAAMHRLLQGQRQARKLDRDAYATAEHAARVAWRVTQDWLSAQLAIIETQMVALDQVMLPYLQVDLADDGRQITLYDRYREREQAALGQGGEG